MNIVLIPSYEPDEKLVRLINDLVKTNYEIIVVNDGSKKEYDKIFDKIKDKCILLGYKENHGKGYALKTGFKYIKKTHKKNYVIVTMDSDGQHTLKDATKLLKYANEHRNELVTGMRIRNEKVPLRSRIGNGITRFIYRNITSLDVYDTQTGLRAFSSDLMDYMLNIEGDRFDYEMNVLLRCAKDGIKIKEIKIETIYIDNNKGTHFKAISDSYKVYKEIIKYIFSSLSSFIIDYSLYTIFSILSGNLILSNIIARIISSIFNYNINKSLVFKSKKKTYKSALGYFSLVILILIINTLVLNLIVKFGINAYVGKLVVEAILFVFSFLIQKLFVFKENSKEIIDK